MVLRRKSNNPFYLFIIPLFVFLFILAGNNTSNAQGVDMCDGGVLNPDSSGGVQPKDLEVTNDCMVSEAGTYRYKNVNIYNGGTLEFKDADIEFWAKSILVEKDSSLIAGTTSAPIGNNGTLTIYLYGASNDLIGIECKSDGGTCGVPEAIWNSNTLSERNPSSCVKNNLPGGVTDECFYQYGRPDPISGSSGMFGAKVFAVSYGATVQMYGANGATINDSLPPSSSGTSWARLNTGGILDKGATSLTLDREVDWKEGDHVVITSTDYLPSHSEKLRITSKTGNNQFDFEVLNPHTNEVITGGLQYPHNGKTFPVDTPTRLEQGIKEAETRAAVALLTRSIRIVSAGDSVGQPFGAPTPGNFFGGHMMIRQGVESVQVQGVEFYQLGQGGRKGRYPVHFHLMRTVPEGTFAKDNSVHDSMTRWYTLHGTQGLELSRNVGYMSIGHGYYIEDGTETDNKLYSNIGILARAAIKNAQNPREVPGILAYTGGNKFAETDVPYRSDYIQPTVFWIMSGWNDFQYNMAAGANTCGACYWWLPSEISGPSQKMKWESYASQQSNPSRAGITPLMNFKGNYCSSAMNSFNSTADISPCKGVAGPNVPFFDPVVVGNLSPAPQADRALED
ncbi:MAG: G8 domain-containing protein, partial [Thermodesulfobacteriota bacterium]